jgi:hypothetical protein
MISKYALVHSKNDRFIFDAKTVEYSELSRPIVSTLHLIIKRWQYSCTIVNYRKPLISKGLVAFQKPAKVF